MRSHRLMTSMRIPLSVEKVFPFFCDVLNLQRITPPELDFKIITPLPIDIKEGAVVDYQLRLFRIPFRWRSEITLWDPPNAFEDTQVNGPYRRWVHKHRFYEEEGATVIGDEVCYQLPVWPLGEVAYPLIRIQLRRIFLYRQRTIRRLLLDRPDGNAVKT